jgi:UDP-glucose 4-epimerase
MNILVTGAGGFIGQAFSRYHNGLTDYKIYALDLVASPTMSKCNLLTDDHVLQAYLDLSDVVIHLADDSNARNLEIQDRINMGVKMTCNLLEAMVKSYRCKYIIYASSSAVYGNAKNLPTPETEPCYPISYYGASKLACEAFISSYCHLYGLRAVIYRIANVVGPTATHGVVLDLYRKYMEAGDSVEVLGDGQQSKSYIHISDVISALNIAVETWPLLGKTATMNVGTDDQVSVWQIANFVERATNKPKTVKFVPDFAGDVKNMLLDTSKLKRYGWSARYDSSRDAIRSTIKEMIEKRQKS